MSVSVVACPRFEPTVRQASEFRRTIGGNIVDLRRVGKGGSGLSLPMIRQLRTSEILQRNQRKRLAPPRRRDLCLMVWTQWGFSLSRSAYLFGARLPACLSPKSGSAFRISLSTADYKTAQLRAARIASWMLSVKVAEDPESALRRSPAFDGYGTSAYDYPKPIRHARFCNSATTAPAREPPRAEPCGRRP
jgi:hypothetical protein